MIQMKSPSVKRKKKRTNVEQYGECALCAQSLLFRKKKYAFQNWIICKCIEKNADSTAVVKVILRHVLFTHSLLLVFCRWLDCWVMPSKKFHVCLMQRHNMTMSRAVFQKFQKSNLIQLTKCWNLIVWEIESSDKNVWQPYFIARLLYALDPVWIFKWWLMMNIWLIDSILIWSSLLVIRL